MNKITVSEACKLLGVSRTTVLTYIENGKLPATWRNSRTMEVLESDVLALAVAPAGRAVQMKNSLRINGITYDLRRYPKYFALRCTYDAIGVDTDCSDKDLIDKMFGVV